MRASQNEIQSRSAISVARVAVSTVVARRTHTPRVLTISHAVASHWRGELLGHVDAELLEDRHGELTRPRIPQLRQYRRSRLTPRSCVQIVRVDQNVAVNEGDVHAARRAAAALPPRNNGHRKSANARLHADAYRASSSTSSRSSSASSALTLSPRRAATARAFFKSPGSIATVIFALSAIHVKCVKARLGSNDRRVAQQPAPCRRVPAASGRMNRR